jgi:hypothetical protein
VTLVMGLVGLALVVLCAVLMAAMGALRRKTPTIFREIAAFTRLRHAVGRVVEDGSRLHVSLGRGGITTPQSASGLVGLTLLGRLAELTAAGDQPPIATSGDAALAILSQDTLRTASQSSSQATYDPSAGRLTGLTPFSYAAGVIPAIRDEHVSTTVLLGNFGVEIALLTDAAERQGTFTMAGSDNIVAQAISYASALEPLIGEEVFAGGAYTEAGTVYAASLNVQDVLRWLIIIVILGGIGLKLAGVL